MSVEKLHVLEMLSAGKLTIEEADALLAALDTDTAPAPAATRTADATWPAPFTETAQAAPTVRPAPSPSGRFTLDQIAAFRGAGLDYEPSVTELIAPSNAGAKPDEVESPCNAGSTYFTVADLITLANAGVRADYVEELYEAGPLDLTVQQLIGLQCAGVDGNFVDELYGHDNPHRTPESLIQRRRRR